MGHVQFEAASGHACMHVCRYVQWCHGAPSLIPLLAKAAEVLDGHVSQATILDAAKKAADVVWEQGLLTKARVFLPSLLALSCNTFTSQTPCNICFWGVRGEGRIFITHPSSFWPEAKVTDRALLG